MKVRKREQPLCRAIEVFRLNSENCPRPAFLLSRAAIGEVGTHTQFDRSWHSSLDEFRSHLCICLNTSGTNQLSVLETAAHHFIIAIDIGNGERQTLAFSTA